MKGFPGQEAALLERNLTFQALVKWCAAQRHFLWGWILIHSGAVMFNQCAIPKWDLNSSL